MSYSIKPDIEVNHLGPILQSLTSQEDLLVLTSEPIYVSNKMDKMISGFSSKSDFILIKDIPSENPFSYIKTVYDRLSFTPKLIIAIGGGSVIDLAKAMSVAKDFSEIKDLFYQNQTIDNKYSKVYAFPTTFGTGAEISYGSILYDDSAEIKNGIRGNQVQVDKVFLDFELYKTASKRIKALSGFDCLTHAIETYISKKSNEVTRYMSVNVINMALENLCKAIDDDQSAVCKMAISSMLMGANLAFSSTCLPHRLQYVIGPMTHTSHSEGLAALYKGWLNYISQQNEKPLQNLCQDLGMPTSVFIEKVNKLKDDLGISLSLSDLGLHESDLGSIIDALNGSLSADPYYKDDSTIISILKLAL